MGRQGLFDDAGYEPVIDELAYEQGYEKGYAEGSLEVTTEILDKFLSIVQTRITDALSKENDIEGTLNLLNDIKKEMQDGN